MDTQAIRYRSASANLSFNRKGDLAFIGSLVAEERRRGHATGVLHLICERADTEGFDLRLTVESEGGSEDLDNAELIRFYGRFGFEQINPNSDCYLGRSSKSKQS